MRATCLVVLFLGLLGCDDDSSDPTRPEPPAPAANVVFSGAQAIAPHHDLIRTLLDDVTRRADVSMDVGQLTVTVLVDAATSIPGWGLGGYTVGPNDIEIVVDPEFGSLDSVLRDRLPALAAHEIHHTVRWRAVGPPFTLLEALCNEGLADHFALELIDSAPPPWIQAFPVSERSHFEGLAEPELDEPFTYDEWFFGRVRSDLPHWTGYTLGYLLVEDVLMARGRTAAALVAEPATSFDPR